MDPQQGQLESEGNLLVHNRYTVLMVTANSLPSSSEYSTGSKTSMRVCLKENKNENNSPLSGHPAHQFLANQALVI